MLNIGADLEDYHEYYRLSNKDYYYDLHLEHDATKEQIKIAFKELALRLHLDKNNGDKRAENAFKRIRTAKEVLVDPIRRAQYDNDLLVKAFHFNGQGSGGQLSEDARMEELRKWSYEEGQRQMAKERAERRAGDQARFEADEEELQDLEAEMKEHQRQADLTSIRQKKQEEKKKGVQAEKERRAEDQRSRNRQISEILEEKLAVEARKLQAEADLQALFEERERKAREIEEARLERKRAAEEIDRKRKEGLAAARKQKQGISQSIEAEEHANTQEHTPRLATRVGGRGRRK